MFRGSKTDDDSTRPRLGSLAIDPAYETETQRLKTVTILGASGDSNAVERFSRAAEESSRGLVTRGYNILTGGGNQGIMGAAGRGAALPEDLTATMGEHRVILVPAAWAPVDLRTARVIATVQSEQERIELFQRVSATFLVFPGGAGTLQELCTLIASVRYGGSGTPLRIILVDRVFYEDFVTFLNKLETSGVLGARVDDLLRVVEVLDACAVIAASMPADPD